MEDAKLIIETQLIEDKAIINFKGKIDEDSDFESLIKLQQKSYIFDFNDVSFINSCGIREWINFLEKLPQNLELTYKNCPQVIMEQMSMVHGFVRDGATIESFYAPYYCEECDIQQNVLLTPSQIINGKAPGQQCSKCQNEMEFDDIEDQYFGIFK